MINRRRQTSSPRMPVRSTSSSSSSTTATTMADGRAPETPAAPAMPPISKLMPMGVMLLLNKYNLEEMGYTKHIEGAYIVVQVLTFCCLMLINQRIAAAPDEPDAKKLQIPEQVQMGQVIKPAAEQTLKEHDEEKWKEQRQQLLMGAVILGGVYYKWQYIMPLVLQCLMTPVGMIESPLFKIYVLGGEVARPFPKPSPFGDLFPTAPEEPTPEPTAVAAISAAEATAQLGATGLTATEQALKKTAAGKKKAAKKTKTETVQNPAESAEEKVD